MSAAVEEQQLELDFEESKPVKEQVRTLAFFAGTYGITVAEVRERLGLHHGSASSALTVLAQEGSLVLLDETRERCHVYVVPGSVQGRARATPRQKSVRVSDSELHEAFQRGRHNGREDTLMEVFVFVRHLRAATMEGIPVKRHDKHCYKQHPECALRSVMRFVQHKGGIQDAIPQAARPTD